jgi:uncharacterized membrane protein
MSKRWIGAILVLGMVVFSLAVYADLPARVPTHWNMRGDVDGWSNKIWGAFLLPGAGALLLVLMPLLRRIDPRNKHYERFDNTFWLIVNIILVFMLAMHVLSLGVALGWPLNMGRVMNVVVGLMLMGLGNYLPRVRSNWWMGIRTPWTLDSERVWRETHRVAGYAFVAAGAVTLLSSFLPPAVAFTVCMVSVGTAALLPMIYSFMLYRREKTEKRA